MLQRPDILDHAFSVDEHIAAWFQVGLGSDELSAIPCLPATLQRGMTVAVCTYKRPASLDRFLESLANQDRIPDQLIVVDASPDETTERVVRARARNQCLSLRLLYCRVKGPLKGLTHQRNFALRLVGTDLIAFFDDDVTLHTQCLSELEKAYQSEPQTVGVGAAIENVPERMDWSTRFRVMFGVIPRGPRGRYHRSGFQTSWYPLPKDDAAVEGDYLHGCGMMWRTEIARKTGFYHRFSGYSQGEDLDFSLQMRKTGKILLANRARMKHLHDPAGRPDAYKHGYMVISNLFEIHRRAFPDRTWRDLCFFAYAWTLDTIWLSRYLLFPTRIRSTLQHIIGRAVAAFDISTRRRPAVSKS